jgi:hypothetical protein
MGIIKKTKDNMCCAGYGKKTEALSSVGGNVH